MASILPRGWWGTDFPGYRDYSEASDGAFFDYDPLPPLEEDLTDEFDWLLLEPVKEEPISRDFEGVAESLWLLSQHPDMELPPAFVNFLSSPEYYTRIASRNCEYLRVADWPVMTGGCEIGYLIRFLSDVQSGFSWYLYVNTSGEHCVLAASDYIHYKAERNEETQSYPKAINLENEDIRYCAASFSEFIYRYWIEDEICYALCCKEQKLTLSQQRYLDHYRR